jgi:hypothetical protein
MVNNVGKKFHRMVMTDVPGQPGQMGRNENENDDYCRGLRDAMFFFEVYVDVWCM